MTTSQPWVDGPFELIPATKCGDTKENPVKGTRRLAAEMTIVHNCILRGANAVYLQCVNVAARGSAKDKLDFANFAYQWMEMLLEHHDQEEELIFPQINELTGVSNLMDPNVEEHELFHDGAVKYTEYLAKVKKEEEELDGEKLKAIMDEFMPVLRTHLYNEIDTLTGLGPYEDKVDWGKWFNDVVSKVVMNAMRTAEYRQRVFPLTFIFHDKTFADGVWENFPPIPWIAKVFMQWMYVSKHLDWWRFAGCDINSTPKELPFL